MNPPEKIPLEARSLSSRMIRAWALPIILGSSLAALWILYVNRSDGSSFMQQKPIPEAIDGDRAYGYLKAICNFGPRKAGSKANTQQREYVAAHFKKMGATLREQKFATQDPLSGERVDMVNLIASWNPDRSERVVVAAHYDTRPFPDPARDPDNANVPFIGANDGASGVALLMEMANHMNESKTPWGVDFVLFDGEELMYNDPQQGRLGDFFLGSNEFSRIYKAEGKNRKYQYVAGIVLDMVGDKQLELPVELNSKKYAPNLVREVWGVAYKMKSKAFIQNLGPEVLDDHLSMNAAGIPTIDIIDFDYPMWHTSGDLPEQCSGKSLAEVGRVVTAWLNQPKAARSKKR